MIKKVICLCFFSLTLLLVGFALIPLAQAQEEMTPKPDPVAHLPRFVTAESVFLDEDQIGEDVVAAGGQLVVRSEIDGDLIAAGGQLEVAGLVSQDLRLVAGDVVISGQVGQDAMVFGGNVRLTDSAKINGYLIIIGGNVILDGQIGGSVKVMAGSVEVRPSAKIGGDLNVTAGEILVSDQAQIAGEQNLVKTDKKLDRPTAPVKKIFFGLYSGFKLASLLSGLIVLLLLVRLLGTSTSLFTTKILKKPLATLGWGLIKLVVTPIVIFLLFISLIGIPLALIVTVIYSVSLYLAPLVFALAAGQYFIDQKWLKNKNPYLAASLGLVALSLVGVIPLIGGLVKLAALLLGLGAILKIEKKWLK